MVLTLTSFSNPSPSPSPSPNLLDASVQLVGGHAHVGLHSPGCVLGHARYELAHLEAVRVKIRVAARFRVRVWVRARFRVRVWVRARVRVRVRVRLVVLGLGLGSRLGSGLVLGRAPRSGAIRQEWGALGRKCPARSLRAANTRARSAGGGHFQRTTLSDLQGC